MGTPETGDDGQKTLSVTLSLADAAAQPRVGEPISIAVSIRNEGDADVWMVGVVDGSEEGARYPHYRPSIARDGVEVAGPPPPEDPLVGPLRTADFTKLAPGEGFDPIRGSEGGATSRLFTFASFAPSDAGTYTYSLTVSTESESPEQWLGAIAQDEERDAVIALIERVPRLTVASNLLEVAVQ